MLFEHILFFILLYLLKLYGLIIYIILFLCKTYYNFISSYGETTYIYEDIVIPNQNIDEDTHINDIYYILSIKKNKIIANYYYYYKIIFDNIEYYIPSLIINKYIILDKKYKKIIISFMNKIILKIILLKLKHLKKVSKP